MKKLLLFFKKLARFIWEIVSDSNTKWYMKHPANSKNHDI
jgi:hypothetical protein